MDANGPHFTRETPNDLLIIRYYTYLRKTGGSPRPRRVHFSKEFVCPHDLLIGLNQLVSVLEKGENISPYFSRKVDNICEIDGMFNEWGVLHLHLGDRPYLKDARFIARTGPLLFLYLKEDDAFLINVYQHGDWTVKSILHTVHDNWPELIEPFILRRETGLSFQYTEKQHSLLKSKGITTMLELSDVNGNPFMLVPPSHGKDSFQDVHAYNLELKKIRQIERLVH